MPDFFPKNILKKCKLLFSILKCDSLDNEQCTVWCVDGEDVSIPYRVKCKVLSDFGYKLLSKTQKNRIFVRVDEKSRRKSERKSGQTTAFRL